MPTDSTADPSRALTSGFAAQASVAVARTPADIATQARALLMTGGGGTPTDHIDPVLLKAELQHWLRFHPEDRRANISLLRAKGGFEALSQVSERIGNSALKLAWNLLQTETVCYMQPVRHI